MALVAEYGTRKRKLNQFYCQKHHYQQSITSRKMPPPKRSVPGDCRSDSPRLWIVSKYPRCSSVAPGSRSRLMVPVTPFVGVRTSWLMFAKKPALRAHSRLGVSSCFRKRVQARWHRLCFFLAANRMMKRSVPVARLIFNPAERDLIHTLC